MYQRMSFKEHPMKKLKVTEEEYAYKIETSKGEMNISKNKTSTEIIHSLLPLYKLEVAKHEKIISEVLPQYYKSIQTIHLFNIWQEKIEFGKNKEMAEGLQEIHHYLVEWNFFLQDMLKALEIEIPVEMYEIQD